jgi:hypothetical protein
MMKVWIALAILVAVILYFMRLGPGFSPPKYIEEAFIGICPPGQMPASYTAAGGACVPYYF